MSVALYVLITIHKKSETAKGAALQQYYKEQTTSVPLLVTCIPALSSLHRSLPLPQRLTLRYRNSILFFHSAVTSLSQQHPRAVDEKTPLAKGMSRSSTSASSEVGVTKHERWAQH